MDKQYAHGIKPGCVVKQLPEYLITTYHAYYMTDFY